jgi:CBS domain containing-hemolysin-like protein
LGLKLLTPEEEEDIDTLGGLMFALLGRVPARGELVRHPSGLELEVLEADARRLKKVKIHQPKLSDETSVATSGSDKA